MKEFRVRYHLFASPKFLGLGFMINNDVPVTVQKKRFVIEFKLIVIGGWFEIYTQQD